jgi:DNA-directed RNA polymerase specialized sigma24 family protein
MRTDRTTCAIAAHRAATRALRGYRTVPDAVREELAQEATLRTWQAAGVRDPARFAARVARRLGIDWLRRRAERGLTDLSEVQDAADWQRRVEARLDLECVRAAIEGGPRLHRETLLLLFVQELTIEEAVDERLRFAPDGDRALERDLLYQRRTRALTWIRTTVDLAA